MSVSPSVQAIICEEIFDDSSHPSVEEINEYASKIGIDPNGEPHLLHLAKEGLMQALPSDWKPCFDEKSKSYYYYNSQSGRTQWEHPLDDVYRGLVVKLRSNSQASFEEDSRGHEDQTYTKEDLQSFEEAPKPKAMSPVKTLQPLEHKKGFSLSPIRTKSKSLQDFRKNADVGGSGGGGGGAGFAKKRGGRSSTFEGLDFGADRLDGKLPRDDKHPNSIEKGELTLSGGGSMFLKSNTKRGAPPDAEGAPRGILRDGGAAKLALPREPSEEKRRLEPDDDKKIVRFNLEARPDTHFQPDLDFTFSDSEHGSSSDEQVELFAPAAAAPEARKPSRFTVSPVKFDEYAPKKDEPLVHGANGADGADGTDREKARNPSLKLIKPNPTDFITPKLIGKPLDAVKPIFLHSDSEDESVAKYKAKFPKEDSIITEKLTKIQDCIPEESDKFELNVDAKPEQTNETSDELHRETARKEMQDRLQEYKDQLTALHDEQVRKYEAELLENKAKEIQRLKLEIAEKQKAEFDEIVSSEKIRQEERVKEEIEKLKLNLEDAHKEALKENEEMFRRKLDEKKMEMEKQFNVHIEELERSFREKEKEIGNNFQMSLKQTEHEFVLKLEERIKEISVAHKVVLDRMKDDHSLTLEELVRDFKSEEEIIRKEQVQSLSELRDKLARELELERQKMRELGEDRLYEKVRCEKRLLEDKYQCLKEKYLRLKKDVKISLEKRSRRREQALATTGSETERSSSHRKPGLSDSPQTPERAATNPKNHPKLAKDINLNRARAEGGARRPAADDLETSMSERSGRAARNDNEPADRELDTSEDVSNTGRSRRRLFTRLKSSSTSRLNNNSSKIKDYKRSCSPVENLRRQLQKLEDLEDQFPQTAQTDTYHLRYPFTDAGEIGSSSELEFFRHRIHLERDSVRRAKESLRAQRTSFQKRQRELKLRHGPAARSTLQQLYNEERELSDMEVSLHRTRSLLGEKVIRLRHLEQSLQRLSAAQPGDATLSDLSSHSASSGISSTEFATAADHQLGLAARAVHFGPDQLQESSEIMQSLENLNCEIRDIWHVLNKQQHAANVTTIYSDHVWPVAGGAGVAVPTLNVIPTLADRLDDYHQRAALAAHGVQSIVVTQPPRAAQGAAVTTTLVERTKNLRDWLRQAKVEQGENSTVGQATL